MKYRPASELQAGDVVEYRGELHRIIRVDRKDGWAWPVAIADGGWGLALGRGPIAVHDWTR
jgi:hypothetical protein